MSFFFPEISIWRYSLQVKNKYARVLDIQCPSNILTQLSIIYTTKTVLLAVTIIGINDDHDCNVSYVYHTFGKHSSLLVFGLS
jgi:hypothetical protein